MIITMPSGLAGQIRPMKVRDIQALADPSLARGGRALDVMLSVFESITEPGPYTKWSPGSQPAWDDVLQGDVFAALVDIRCATWGPEHAFRVRCGQCSEGYDWELDLRDLTRTPYPASSLAQLSKGANSFDLAGPGGVAVSYKLLFRRDEKAIEAKRRRNGGKFGLGDALAARVLHVEGVKDINLWKWIGDLEAREARAMGEAMQEAEGGIETTIETVCTFCSWQQEIELPFDRAFYSPPKRKVTAETEANPPEPPKASPPAAARSTPIDSNSVTPERKTG